MRSTLSLLGRVPDFRAVPRDNFLKTKLGRLRDVRRYLNSSVSYRRHDEATEKLLDDAEAYIDGGQKAKIIGLHASQVSSEPFRRLRTERERLLHTALFMLLVRDGSTVIAAQGYLAEMLRVEFGHHAAPRAVRNSLLYLERAGLIELIKGKPGRGGHSTRVTVTSLFEPGKAIDDVSAEMALTMSPATSAALDAYRSRARDRLARPRVLQEDSEQSGLKVGGCWPEGDPVDVEPLSGSELRLLHEQAIADMGELIQDLLREEHDLSKASYPIGICLGEVTPETLGGDEVTARGRKGTAKWCEVGVNYQPVRVRRVGPPKWPSWGTYGEPILRLVRPPEPRPA